MEEVCFVVVALPLFTFSFYRLTRDCHTLTIYCSHLSVLQQDAVTKLQQQQQQQRQQQLQVARKGDNGAQPTR